MNIPLDRVIIPVDGSETVIWLRTTCNLSDRVFHHKISVFAALDKPLCSDGLPQFRAIIQSHVARYQRKQDLVF